MRSGFHCPRESEMADRARITDLELEGALRALGPRYPYPSTPNLAVRVRTRLAAPPVRPLPRRAPWGDPRRLALVAALLLLLIGTAALAIPGTRAGGSPASRIRS